MAIRFLRLRSPIVLFLFLVGAILPPTNLATAQPSQVIVNGVPLSTQDVAALQQVYRTAIAPGRYWYDRISGAWGFDGFAIAGLIVPGLPLGGALQPNASNGDSGVFINGRQLTVVEALYIQQACGTRVFPGRYTVLGNGAVGLEGGMFVGNLNACRWSSGGGRSSGSNTSCEGGCCSTSLHGYGGSITTCRE